MMIVVSNATPLIGLAMADRFDLLPKLFGQIIVPQGVYDEVVLEGQERFGAREVQAASYIEIVQVKDRLAVEVLEDELGRGESETIVLAREMSADWVLANEKLARRKLDSLGIRTIGTLGILLRAKELGLFPTVKPDVEKLRTRGFRLSRRVYQDVLKMAGEAE
jgi:predicted nucleic acid-binding protein